MGAICVATGCSGSPGAGGGGGTSGFIGGTTTGTTSGTTTGSTTGTSGGTTTGTTTTGTTSGSTSGFTGGTTTGTTGGATGSTTGTTGGTTTGTGGGGTQPIITSITPDSAIQDGGAHVTIKGTNFASGATVEFQDPNSAAGTVQLTNIVVLDQGTITATVPASSTTGVRDVVVRNPDFNLGRLPSGFRFGRILFQNNFDASGYLGFDLRNTFGDVNLNTAIYLSPPFSSQTHYFICSDPTNPVCGASHQDVNRWVEADFDAAHGYPNNLPEVFIKMNMYFQTPNAGGTKDIQRKIIFIKDPNSGITLPSWEFVLSSDAVNGNIGLRLGFQSTFESYNMFGGSNELPIQPDVNGIKQLMFDRWYSIQLQVKRKTIGQNDSVVRLWIDGVLVFQKATTWVPAPNPCSASTSQICPAFPPDTYATNMARIELGRQADRLNYDLVDEYRYMDDVVIADAYIGP